MNMPIFSRYEISNYKIHICMFVFGLILFAMPSLLRFYFYGITDIVGVPTYLHTRIAEYIISGTFTFYDPLSFGGRTYVYPPLFSYMLAFFGYIFGLKLGGMIFVSVFGGLGLVAFYMIMKMFFKRDMHAIMATVLLALIPGTIFLYSHVSTRAVPVTIALFGLYFVIKDYKKYYKHAGLLLGISALFHPEVAVVFAIIILIYFISNKCRLKNFLRMAIITSVIAMIWYGPFLLSNGFPSANDLHEDYRERRYSLESPSIETYFWELENKGHITLLAGLFAIVGFVKTDNRFLRYWIIFAFIMTLMFERLFIYLPFAAAVFAFIGIKKFSRAKYYKILVIIFVIYTGFFAVNRIDAMAKEYPSQAQIDAMLWIKQNTPTDSVVLSDWQWGHWISGIAGRRNFIDGFAEYVPDVNKRLQELNNFFRTCEIPNGYGINYIYMEDWLIENNTVQCIHSFQLVYNNSYLYVFKV